MCPLLAGLAGLSKGPTHRPTCEARLEPGALGDAEEPELRLAVAAAAVGRLCTVNVLVGDAGAT